MGERFKTNCNLLFGELVYLSVDLYPLLFTVKPGAVENSN